MKLRQTFTIAVLSLITIQNVRAEEIKPADNLDRFEGKIVKVNPPQREIYVFSDGQKNEYYFTDKTVVIKDGQTAPFSALLEGESVRVSAKKIGKRLDPVEVEILSE
jgi:hypothetical protein